MSLADLTQRSVLAAITECDNIGREHFLAKYGFKPTRSHLLLHKGVTYDSTAICSAAHGHLGMQFLPLTADEFTGGNKTVTSRLHKLGFVVVDSAPKTSVRDTDGTAMRATCDLRNEAGRWVLTLHSSGGKRGSATARNPDYKKALSIIASRLAAAKATVHDALVDSSETLKLSRESRRVVAKEPVVLGVDLTAADFVDDVTTRMARVGSAAQSGGNSRKQLRIEFTAAAFSSLAETRSSVVDGASSDLPVFVVTWNPSKWTITEKKLSEVVATTARGEISVGNWATGNRKSGIKPGDHIFLFRQESERGLVAYGSAASTIYEGPHWDGTNKSANYVDINWIEWVATDERMTVETMKETTKSINWDSVLAGGMILNVEDGRALLDAWDVDSKPAPGAHSGDEAIGGLREGAKATVEVNRYERNRRARKECIAHHGTACSACGIDFGDDYGGIAPGFIHVHHIVPISSIGTTYTLDPIKDLIPVCPNCHAMIHHGVDLPRSIDQVRGLVQDSKRSKK